MRPHSSTKPLSRFPVLSLLFLPIVLFVGCTNTRNAGQVELFYVHPYSRALLRPNSYFDQIYFTRRTNFTARWGERIRYSDDVITVQVNGIYLSGLPQTLTGSHDIVVFADVWENSASGYSDTPITSVIYAANNQMIPGKLNFSGNLAYGPTKYKGHPLKIKFTMMILQKEEGKKQSMVADVIGKYASAIPTYGLIASQTAAVMRDMLKAQPDVTFFDYEATFMSDRPAALLPTLNSQVKPGASGKGLVGQDSPPDSKADFVDITPDRVALLDQSTGWLQYGLYALVETKKRPAAPTPPPGGKPASQSKDKEPFLTEVLSKTNRYVLDANSIKPARFKVTTNTVFNQAEKTKQNVRLEEVEDPDSLASADSINGSYIIFSITPQQLSQSDSTLLQAARVNSDFLISLRQTDANVNAALASIDKNAETVGLLVIKNRAEDLAHKAVEKSGKLATPEEFEKEFNKAMADLRAGLGETWNSGNSKAQLDEVEKDLIARYKSRIDELQPKQTYPEAAKNAEALMAIARNRFQTLTNSLKEFKASEAIFIAEKQKIETAIHDSRGFLDKITGNLSMAQTLLPKAQKVKMQWDVETNAEIKSELLLSIRGDLGSIERQIQSYDVSVNSLRTLIESKPQDFLDRFSTNSILVIKNQAISSEAATASISATDEARKAVRTLQASAVTKLGLTASPADVAEAAKVVEAVSTLLAEVKKLGDENEKTESETQKMSLIVPSAIESVGRARSSWAIFKAWYDAIPAESQVIAGIKKSAAELNDATK